MVDAFLLAHEHDLQLLTVWVVVDILGKFLVNGVPFNGNVDRNSRLEVNNVLSQSFNFLLVVLQLLQHVNLILFRLVETLLKLSNVLRRTLKLLLQFGLGLLHVVMMSFPGGQLLFHVFLLGQSRVEFEHSAFKFGGQLLELFEGNGQLVNFEFQFGSHFLHDEGQALNLDILQLPQSFHLHSQFFQLKVEFSSGFFKLNLVSFLLGNQISPQQVFLLQTVTFLLGHSRLDVRKLNQKLALLVFECFGVSSLSRFQFNPVTSLFFVKFSAVESVLGRNLGMQVSELDIKTALLLLKESVVRVNGLLKFTSVSLVDILEFSAVTFLVCGQLVPVFFVYAINSFVQILQLLAETGFLLRKKTIVLVQGFLQMCRISVLFGSQVLSVKSVASF